MPAFCCLPLPFRCAQLCSLVSCPHYTCRARGRQVHCAKAIGAPRPAGHEHEHAIFWSRRNLPSESVYCSLQPFSSAATSRLNPPTSAIARITFSRQGSAVALGAEAEILEQIDRPGRSGVSSTAVCWSG